MMNGYGYQPQYTQGYPQMQPYQQRMDFLQSAQPQQPQQNSGLQARPVTGREEAMAAMVFPGAPVLFFDRAHAAVYYKATDPQTGAAEFVEFVMASPAQTAPQYATLADIDAIRAEIAQVRDMIPVRGRQKGADAE